MEADGNSPVCNVVELGFRTQQGGHEVGEGVRLKGSVKEQGGCEVMSGLSEAPTAGPEWSPHPIQQVERSSPRL